MKFINLMLALKIMLNPGQIFPTSLI
jgi:hypothetical protein